MTNLAILATIAVLPALAILLLCVNGAIAFMSLCLGSVLVTYTSSDVDTVFTAFTNKDALATNQGVQLALLLAPFLLTILFTRGSVKGAKNVVNLFPALATGLLCALLVVPLLPAATQRQVQHLSMWHQLSNAQTAVILAGAVFSLVFLLFTHRKRHGEDEGKSKKRRKE